MHVRGLGLGEYSGDVLGVIATAMTHLPGDRGQDTEGNRAQSLRWMFPGNSTHPVLPHKYSILLSHGAPVKAALGYPEPID